MQFSNILFQKILKQRQFIPVIQYLVLILLKRAAHYCVLEVLNLIETCSTEEACLLLGILKKCFFITYNSYSTMNRWLHVPKTAVSKQLMFSLKKTYCWYSRSNELKGKLKVKWFPHKFSFFNNILFNLEY